MKSSTIHFIILASAFLSIALLIGSASLRAQRSGKVPTREEIDVQYRWDVSDLFESDQAWEEAYEATEEKIGEFAQFEGSLRKSAKNLLACLTLNDEVGIQMGKLFSYAARMRDPDLSNTTYQAMSQRIQSLGTRYARATAYIEPEILAIDDGRLNTFLEEKKELELYRHYLDDLRRQRDHVLSKEQEELLSQVTEIAAGSYQTFGMLTNADFNWGNILDEKEEEVQMSRSRYLLYMTSPDRRVRRDAYRALYVPFKNHLHTLTSLLMTKLKTDIFYMRARKYESSLDAALSGPNIPTEVYHNLIRTLNENLDPLHRWAELKKRVLGVQELHPYDTYAPLFPEVNRTYTYEEAQEIIRQALQPLGPEINKIIERAFADRWIDVYENIGKRGGAYSSGTYGVHPYILMNYNGTLSSVFTLAHELGHTLHSYLSNVNQPYIYSQYASFNAEVASTTNEALLMDYLLENAETDDVKLSLLQQYIQDIGSTFYRQGRFAEFELQVHERVENDEPITYEVLEKLFGELYQKYWGPEMIIDDEEVFSWARIPHFYYNYYVYTYATSFAASQMIARRIRDEGLTAVNDYIRFLSSGGSDYPIELLKIAGVDMSTPAPIEATAEKMDALLDQMEAILAGR